MGGSEGTAPELTYRGQREKDFEGYDRARKDPRIQDLLNQVSSGQLDIGQLLSGNQGGRLLPSNMSSRALTSDTAPTSNSEIRALEKQIADLRQQAQSDGSPFTQFAFNQFTLPKLEQQLKELQSAESSKQGSSEQALMDALSTDPRTAGLLAEFNILRDSTNAKTFGKGGLQDQEMARRAGLVDETGKINSLLDESRNALMGRDSNYGLQNSDLAAYNQVSSNIAKQFGASGNSLAQALASRGLGAGRSGASMQAFSGLLGNQNEQLAKSQLDIAQSRVDTARKLANDRMTSDLKRLDNNTMAIDSSNRTLSGLSDQYTRMRDSELGRQRDVSNDNWNKYQNAATMGLNERGLQQQINNDQWAAKQATKDKSFWEKMGDYATAGIGQGLQEGLQGMMGDVTGTNARTMAQDQMKSGGSGIAGMMSLFGASDETLKTNVELGHEDIEKFLDFITPYKYNYIYPELGDGTYVSPMAQDLEKSELGQSMVINTPVGKMVDYAKGFGVMLAAMGEMHKRIKELEGSK